MSVNRRHVVSLGLLLSSYAVWPALAAAADVPSAGEKGSPPPWSDVRAVGMKGKFKAFWNVGFGGGSKNDSDQQAAAHGFESVNLIGSYSDYGRKEKDTIDAAQRRNPANPWKRPDFFERVIRRNISAAPGRPDAITVHDIEFGFQEDAAKAWGDPAVRATSGAKTEAEFAEAYYREWASWFWLPCHWSKNVNPYSPVGLYGVQPFRRDFWGIAGKSAKQIDGTHGADELLWKWIDPHVDFYIASVYLFYEDPSSIYYLAANVEENCLRVRRYGDKPVYAYEWLRYHDSNKELHCREVAPYLAEAMAVVPYFCGARGVVLWGWEPTCKAGQPYHQLPLFAKSLGRVSDLSERLSKAELVIDEPANVLWKEKRPLVRKFKISEREWAVMAVNPWQKNDTQGKVSVRCGAAMVDLPLDGRHADVFVVLDGKATKVKM